MSKIYPHLSNLSTLDLTFQCITPMFLGGTTKSSVALRTAPFKNLFRQWFRIINGNLTSKELLSKEQELFGSAIDIKENPVSVGASKIRFFIDSCIDEKEKVIKKTIPTNIIEGCWQKMLFGERDKTNPTNLHSYIKEGTKFNLKISFPKQYENTIKQIVKAINEYGTIGLKSRKAFGSIQVTDGINLNEIKLQIPNSEFFDEKKEYPHCIYKKWKTKSNYDNWYKTLEALLKIYGNYIETKYKDITLQAKSNRKRAPTQTRLIIKKENGKYIGKILHLRYNYSFYDVDWDEIYKNIEDGNMIEEEI